MAGISIGGKGDFSKTLNYFKRVKEAARIRILEKYGEKGVAALASATPVRTGLTASSWYYRVERSGNRVSLIFLNSHLNKGVNIAVILQLGHGTGTGGWVEGRDYINPAIRPIFDEIVEKAWKEATSV